MADPAPNPAVKGQWFRDRMADADLSGRRVAQMMGMDNAVFTKRVNGIYQWSAREIADWAAIVKVPLEDALKHAGIRLHESRHVVPIVGTVAADGTVALGDHGKKVEKPDGVVGTLEAILFRANGHPADGWVLYYDPRPDMTASVGRVSVVKVAGRGRKARWMVRVLARGFADGTWDLRSLSGDVEPIEGVLIERASPVVWIKT